MFKIAFVIFAGACLLQRLVEIVRNDRNVGQRRPHWTAIAITVVFLAFSLGSVAETLLVDRPPRPIVSGLGGLLFAAGFAIRQAVVRALGKLWAIDVDIKPDHHLVTSGPYRYCRHPNYVAMLLEMLGFCLIPQAYMTIAVTLPLYVAALAARIRTEEGALVSTFGDEYRAYQRSTFALLPLPVRSRR